MRVFNKDDKELTLELLYKQYERGYYLDLIYLPFSKLNGYYYIFKKEEL